MKIISFLPLVIVTVLAGFLQPVRADGHPPHIEWQGWSVYSNEIWNLDMGPQPQFPLRYPLTHLFDDNPDTTWAFEDGQRPQAKAGKQLPNQRPYLQIRPEKPVTMDSLWLMNGYNKRPDLFQRNDRIVRLTISINYKKVKDVFLKDTMGWHKIDLPRQRVESISLEFTGIRKGEGDDNDLCVSELAFYNRGQKIGMNMPQAVIYNLSSCCGGTGYFMKRDGKVVVEGSWGEGLDLTWNPRGNLVAGIDEVNNKQRLWVADAKNPRIKRSFYPSGGIQNITWKNNRIIEMTLFDAILKRERKQKFRL